jgi:hypothetical protein
VRVLMSSSFIPAGFLDRDVDTVTCVFVARVGQGGHGVQERAQHAARTFSRAARRGHGHFLASSGARSSTCRSPGARPASTWVTSSMYRYAVALDRPRPRAQPADASLVAEPGQAGQRLPVTAQPAGSFPGPDLATARCGQAGNEQDQVPGDVEHDRTEEHAERLPALRCSSAGCLMPGVPRLRSMSAYARAPALMNQYAPFAGFASAGKPNGNPRA